MNNKLLIIILCLIAVGTSVFMYPYGIGAVGIGGVLAGLTIAVCQFKAVEKDFLLRVFLIGLILRTLFALFINVYSLQEFFGPDALYYDWLGWVLSSHWLGNLPASYPDLVKIRDTSQSGWGMNYIVGAIYFLVGQNTLAVQFFCAVIGAATAPITYLCSREIFSNKRVGRVSAMIVALCPSLIIWSSQGLKDGIIVFFLVLSMVCVLHLQKKFNYLSFPILMFSLFVVLTLRFYIFYMLIVAIVGCFALGGKELNPVSALKRVLVILVIGIALTSLGSTGERDISNFNLQKVNQTREDLARGNAGYGKELDVSTTQGALSALPLGFTYLMLAPFPWQLGNLRQAITLPEMLLWWMSIPFLITGLWYAIKQRLRTSIGVLLFTLMLTISYSLYQGNIGTAYRQRAQIQIFHFMFIAVGWSLWKEKRENKNQIQRAAKMQKQRRLWQPAPQFIVRKNEDDFEVLRLEKGVAVERLFDSKSFSEWNISPDGRTLIRSFYDKASRRLHVALNDINTMNQTKLYHLAPLDILRWTPDGKGVLYGGDKPLREPDSVLWLYDFSRNSSKQAFNFNPDMIYSADFSLPGGHLTLGRGKIASDLVLHKM